MRLYRGYPFRHRKTAFSGEGAALHGGRWNSPGVPVIYTATSFALLLLEIMVNGRRTGVPSDTAFSSVDVPEDVEIKRIAASDLPRRWYDYPAPAALQRIGDAWARSNDTVAMLVPSAVVPIEYNALLNPKHPDFARLTIHPTERMRVDRRLTGGR